MLLQAVNMCISVLVQYIDCSNILQLLQLALAIDSLPLKAATIDFIVQNFQAIYRTQEFRTASKDIQAIVLQYSPVVT